MRARFRAWAAHLHAGVHACSRSHAARLTPTRARAEASEDDCQNPKAGGGSARRRGPVLWRCRVPVREPTPGRCTARRAEVKAHVASLAAPRPCRVPAHWLRHPTIVCATPAGRTGKRQCRWKRRGSTRGVPLGRPWDLLRKAQTITETQTRCVHIGIVCRGSRTGSARAPAALCRLRNAAC